WEKVCKAKTTPLAYSHHLMRSARVQKEAIMVEAPSAQIAQQRVQAFAERVQAIRQALHQVVIGQDTTIDLLLTCCLTGSHALLVGVPGLAKTLMVKALASAFQWRFARVQFTPDLMPSDITGYELLGRNGQADGPSMVFRPGPVFA